MYKHTQVGWVMLFVAAFITFFLRFALFRRNNLIITLAVPLLISIIILLLFATVTVTVNNEFIKLSFGIGLIKREIALEDVVSCKVVKNRWWWGWGIHGQPGKAWLYNVSGLDSIELTMKNGMKYLIGTDQPNQLYGVIQQTLR